MCRNHTTWIHYSLMKTNTNQPGSRPAPTSNASETYGAVAALTEQSNGTFPFGNSQNVDHSTGYGNASQWQWSNEESDYPNSENRQAWNSEIPDEIIFNDKDGELSEEPPNIQKKQNPGDSEKSGSHTGKYDSDHEHDSPQRHHEGQQKLHHNVTLRHQRNHEYRTPRHHIRTASREASSCDRNDSDRTAIANIHDNDAAGAHAQE